MNHFLLFACCVSMSCTVGFGFKGFVPPKLRRQSTTSRLTMSSSSALGVGDDFKAFATSVNAIGAGSVNNDIINTDPQPLGIQDILHQALVNHELAVSCTALIMAGIGYMLFRQLSEEKRGIGDYWFTIILLGDLAYSIKG